MNPNQTDGEPAAVLLVLHAKGYAGLMDQALKCRPGFVCHVEQVGKLSQALECLAKQTFSVVLLDLELPDCPGLEALKQIRIRAPGVPVIVLAGAEDEDLAVRAVKEGAQDYLVKWQRGGSPQLQSLMRQAVRYAIERHRTAAQLEESLFLLGASEAQFRTLIERNADAVLVVDKEGMVQFANPAAAKLLGCPADQMLGRSLGVPIVESEATEVDVMHEDGTALVAELRVVPIEWKGTEAYLASLHDVSRCRQLERETTAFHRLLEVAFGVIPCPVVVLDAGLNVLRASSHFAELQGGGTAEVVARPLETLKPFSQLSDGQVIGKLRTLAQTGGHWETELPLAGPSGVTTPVRLHAHAFSSGFEADDPSGSQPEGTACLVVVLDHRKPAKQV
ncbi:MAG: hypothetical protein A3K19_17910 [Lentisphaerae bacterium RIFOXYB12_FULL_65_16]|nr:MAG: hypothetical protein A3K18_11090 [Lentisphaerae bacterium RIFOXYA12_64_32]OGV87114.1 MAG: hypothetical protein A3K19_17910 [Lentisphaerae bacterium RIFOXYB12_FULL_65_16]